MAENATLQLPKDLIEAVINQEVQKSIALALSDKRVFVDAVAKVLTTKVDYQGNPDNGYRSTPFIEFAVEKAIQSAVKTALNDEITNYKDQIKQMIAADLKKKNSPMLKSLVDVMTKGIIDASSCSYRLTINMAEKTNTV
jgi:hypothetical protein